MKQMKRFIECTNKSSSSRSAKRTITNRGKARVQSTERSSQNVQAAAEAQQMGYKMKTRMRKAIKGAILKEKAAERIIRTNPKSKV